MVRYSIKAQIRQICIAQRKNLNQQFIVQASQKIADSIQNLSIYQEAEHLAWYFPVNGEVDLSPLWKQALKNKKKCYFPAVQKDQSLHFLPYTLHTPLILNHYQILEPSLVKQNYISPKLDIIFLPIVAFDNRCMRLGMGKGYYDKTLIHYPEAHLIGVAYEWQKQTDIPIDPWDVQLDMIVTEEKLYL